MQIASLFASLGFKVDDKGLDLFQSKLRSVRADTAFFARKAKALAENLRSMSASLDGVTARLDKVGLKKANANISDSYTEVAKSVARVHKALNGIANNQKRITQALGKIHGSIKVGTPMWDNYTASVLKAKAALTSVNGTVQQIRKNGSVSVRTTTTNNSVGGFGGGFGGSRNRGGFGGFGGDNNFGGGFFRAMLPAVATVGGLPTAGYAVKEIVQSGREVQKMNIVLQMASKNTAEFNRNLEFVKATANEVGVDVVEFGQAYAKMLSATKGVDTLKLDDKEKMFKDLSIYMRTIGTTTDDQKGVFRALTQMFTKGKVQAEELLQMAERGVPAAIEIKKAAMEGLNMTEAQFEMAQKKGQLDPSKLLPIMSENLAKLAIESGAYAKALKTSATAQQVFMNKLKLTAGYILENGLDEGLNKLFTIGVGLLDILTSMVKGFVLLKKSMDDATGGNALLVASLGGLLFVVLKNYKALIALWQVFRLFKAVGGLSAIFAGGVIGRALILAARFTLVGTAIYGLMKYAQALSDSEKGYTTWIDVYGMKLQLLYAKIENFILKTKVLWKEQGVSGILSGLKDILFPELYTDQMFKPKTRGNEQSLRGNPAPPKPVIPYKNQTTSVPTQPMSAQSFNGTLDIKVNGEYRQRLNLNDVGNQLATIQANV